MGVQREEAEGMKRQPCRCSHSVSEHRVADGACRGCGCEQFMSDEYLEMQAKWTARLSSRWWMFKVAVITTVVLLAFVIIVHWLNTNAPAVWWQELIRTAFIAYALRPTGWIVGAPLALFRRLGCWVDRKVEERPYDHLQDERIRKMDQ